MSDLLPKPKPVMEYPTPHLRRVYLAGTREEKLQVLWRLEGGEKEWRDVPLVLTDESGVSFG